MYVPTLLTYLTCSNFGIFSTSKCNGYSEHPEEEIRLIPELHTEFLLKAVREKGIVRVSADL